MWVTDSGLMQEVFASDLAGAYRIIAVGCLNQQ